MVTRSTPTFQTPSEWRRQLCAELDDEFFVAAVNGRLDDIGAAKTYQVRKALAASFGGFLRLHRSSIRQRLGIDLVHRLEERGLVSTQTVAGVVMKQAFGEAVATRFLQQQFALSGRDAKTKHVAAARAVLGKEPDLIAPYARLYDWYVEALRRQVKMIRLQRRIADDTLPEASSEALQEPSHQSKSPRS